MESKALALGMSYNGVQSFSFRNAGLRCSEELQRTSSFAFFKTTALLESHDFSLPLAFSVEPKKADTQ